MEGKSGVSDELVTSLPKGGGGNRPVDESLQIETKLNTGSVGYRMPIGIPPGRIKGELDLVLRYNSAANGNSAIGIGWDCPILSIKVNTKKGIPSYDSNMQYQLSTGEELVHVGSNEYRTRIEEQFRKIIKYSDHWEITERNGTKLVLGDNTNTRLADPKDSSRIFQWFLHKREDTNGNIVEYDYLHDGRWVRYPESRIGAQVYPRTIKYVNTDDGRFLNAVFFDYDYCLKNQRRPDYWTSYRAGFPVQTNWVCKRIVALTSNIDSNNVRSIDFTSGNSVGPLDPEKYIRYGVFLSPKDEGTIEYSEDTADKRGIACSKFQPLQIDFPIAVQEVDVEIYFEQTGQFVFTVKKIDGNISSKMIDVNSIGNNRVTIAANNEWINSFSIEGDSKAYYLKNMTMGADNELPVVFSRYDLDYHETLNGVAPASPGLLKPTVLLLKSTNRIGYDNSFKEERLPPFSFDYTRYSTQNIWPRTLDNTPNESLKDHNTTLISFIDNGRVDILQTKVQHSVHLNKGSIGNIVATDRKELIESPTVTLDDFRTRLFDVNGKGSVDLSSDAFFYNNPATDPNGYDLGALKWGQREQFDSNNPPPQLNPSESLITRSIELNADGAIDLLKTGEDFVHFKNNGDKTWSEPIITSRIHSWGDKEWPDVSFDDERIFVVEMNSDGLHELVRVSNRKVEYWSQVDGQWQFKTTMKNSPRLQEFNPKRVLVSDVTNDGFADLSYVHADRISIYLNIGGHEYAETVSINYADYQITRGLPIPDDADSLEIVDLNGDGVKGLLWSFEREEEESNYFYIPLTGGVKPNLLASIENGIGGRIEIEYSSSSLEAIRDEQNGLLWQSYIPFPLVVASTIRKLDMITGNTEETQITYKNGYYDRINRELQGFGEVSEIVIGDDSAHTSEIRHYFHNQNLSGFSGLDLAKARTLSGKEYRRQIIDRTTGSLINETHSFWKPLEVYKWEQDTTGDYVPSTSLNDGNPENTIVFPVKKFELEQTYEGTSLPKFALGEYVYEAPQDSNIADEFGNLREDIFYGEVEEGSGSGALVSINIDGQTRAYFNVSDNNEQKTICSYAINRNEYIVNLISKKTTWAGTAFDMLIGEERFYYDGGTHKDDHLPLGEVRQGNLQRQESLWILEDTLIRTLGNDVVQHLGSDETQGSGFFMRETTANGERGLFIISYRNDFIISGGKIKYGVVKTIYDARGSKTAFTRDRYRWFVREIINELGHKVTIEEISYPNGLPSSISDANNNREKNDYDAFGRVIFYYSDMDNHPDPITQYMYYTDVNYNDPARKSPTFIEIKRLIDDTEAPKRYIQAFTYQDGFNRELQTRISSEKNNGQDFVVVSNNYNKKGLKQVESLPYHGTAGDYSSVDWDTQSAKCLEYDAMGRIIKSLWSDDSFSKINYLPWVVEEHDEEDTDPNSPHKNTPTSLFYDAERKLVRVKEILREPDSPSDIEINTNVTYNKSNSEIDIVNAKGQNILFFTSLLGDTIHINHPDAGDRWFMYDSAGNLIYSKDAVGNIIWRHYDELSRLEHEVIGSDPNGSTDTLYEYDEPNRNAVGRLWHVKCNSEQFEEWLRYDKRGNVTKQERKIGRGNKRTFEMTHNTLNLIKTKDYDNGAYIVSNKYGVDGKIINFSLYIGANNTTKEVVKSITYHPVGAVEEINFFDGQIVTTRRYEPVKNLLSEIKTTNRNGNILQLLNYSSYDNVGNLLGIDDSTDALNIDAYVYSYNSLYWLREGKFASQVQPNYRFGYKYDHLGNFENNEEYNTAEKLWYDSNNKPNAIRGIDSNHNLFNYDANGHLIKSDRLKELKWNAREQLKSITNSSEDLKEIYLYAPDNIRTYKKTERVGHPQVKTSYFSRDYEIRNNQPTLYICIGAIRVSRVDNRGNVHIFLRNHIGNIDKWVKEDGSIDPSYTEIYQPYGDSLSGPAAGDKRYRFTGKERDSSGLYYFGARYFDGIIGRFISPDPLYFVKGHENLESAHSLNLYCYASINPINRVDHLGLADIGVAISYKPTRKERLAEYKEQSRINWEKARQLYKEIKYREKTQQLYEDARHSMFSSFIKETGRKPSEWTSEDITEFKRRREMDPILQRARRERSLYWERRVALKTAKQYDEMSWREMATQEWGEFYREGPEFSPKIAYASILTGWAIVLSGGGVIPILLGTSGAAIGSSEIL